MYEAVMLSLEFTRECSFRRVAKSVAFVTLVVKTRGMQALLCENYKLLHDAGWTRWDAASQPVWNTLHFNLIPVITLHWTGAKFKNLSAAKSFFKVDTCTRQIALPRLLYHGKWKWENRSRARFRYTTVIALTYRVTRKN